MHLSITYFGTHVASVAILMLVFKKYAASLKQLYSPAVHGHGIVSTAAQSGAAGYLLQYIDHLQTHACMHASMKGHHFPVLPIVLYIVLKLQYFLPIAMNTACAPRVAWWSHSQLSFNACRNASLLNITYLV